MALGWQGERERGRGCGRGHWVSVEPKGRLESRSAVLGMGDSVLVGGVGAERRDLVDAAQWRLAADSWQLAIDQGARGRQGDAI